MSGLRSDIPTEQYVKAIRCVLAEDADNILENATALGSRIPPHAVLMQVNENTPVKLKIIFAI